MTEFKLDTDLLSANNDTLMKIRNDIYNTMSEISKYDVNVDGGFNFSKARYNIVVNLNQCNNTIKHTIKYINKVIDSHMNLYEKTCSLLEDTDSNSNSSTNSNKDNGVNISSKVKKIEFLKINKDLESANSIGKINYSKEGILIHDNYFLVSCNDSMGKVGDKMVMTLKDGRIINCMVGSVNNNKDSIEFIIGKNSDGSNIGSFVSILQSGVTKIVNNGGSL